ncbi:Ferric reductase transmembrane component 3 [Vanrija pseudolonga]|uniref:ferric-chelate reductase (NADPH) n=1 Tax=Vanrija pseudolonga TaxID=143232 RepID=A0AAF1BLR2_9TREE|nr:Ferric reductase transmembrane component 3 [Vanrija pseudolonga]
MSSSGAPVSAAASSAVSKVASATASASKAAVKIDKVKRLAHRTTGMTYQWYIITGCVFGLGVWYAASLVRSSYLRRKGAAARAAGTSKESAAAASGGASASNVPRALGAWFDNYRNIAVLPLFIYKRSTLNEWFFTIAYTAIVIALGLRASGNQGTWDIANPMGMVAFAQMPFIVGLASKNNVLSALTGISYEKFNYLHRAAGRVCVLTTALHTFAWVKKGLGTHGPGNEVFTTGVIAAVGLLMMFLTSFQPIRQLLYEFFLLCHIAFGLMFIIAAYYHWPPFSYWVWPCFIIWGLDRFASLARMVVINKAWLLPFASRRAEHSACKVELVDPNVVRITVNRPILRWIPGQHAYVTMPQVASLRYEQHPFTLATIPDESGDAVFIVRAQTGFTRRLVNSLTADVTTDLNAYIEGPYGTTHRMNHFDSVLLVAGGTGITFALSHLLDIIKHGREGKSAVGQVHLVWNVRQGANVAWIAPYVNAALEKGSGNTRVVISVYITRSHASDEPNADSVDEADTEPNGVETPATGSDSSSASVDEKDKDHSHKYLEASGLSAPAAAVTRFYHGRSHVEHIVRSDLAASTADAAGLGIAVCGPTSLLLDSRRAVFKVNSASAVLQGQKPLSLHCQTFGW